MLLLLSLLPPPSSLLPLNLAQQLTGDAQALSSIAVIVGAIFVFFQLRQNNMLIRASNKQAEAAVVQAQLTTDQMKQNNELADMDLVMRLYEFANTAEVQSAWLTVLHSNLTSEEDWQNMPRQDQVSFYQIAALFESLGVLVQRGLVRLDVIDDTFQTELAWSKLRPFAEIMKKRLGDDMGYIAFETLYKKTREMRGSP